LKTPKPPTMQNLVAISKKAGDIRDRKFVLPQKVGQSTPKNV